MQQFLFIAAAHFLALLLPGPDFFLIARSALASGWRVASGACVGVAVANGLFIAVAFAGMAALRPDSHWFVVLQLAGCIYLLYLGVLFVRCAGASPVDTTLGTTWSAASSVLRSGAWWRAAGMGFASGILNPKNALFYASLATMLTGPQASAGWKLAYGLWMFSVVLLWDLLVAVLIGNPLILRRFALALPWLERMSGLMLIALALGVVTVLLRR